MLRYITGLAAAAAILTGPALAGNPPDIEWQRTFGSWDTICRCVQQTSDNGFIIAGHVRKSLTNSDVYLLKTDFLGNTQWQRCYGGPDKDCASAVRQTGDGGYVVTYGGDILKTDSLGESLWTYTGPVLSDFDAVEQTSDGGYIAAGIWPYDFLHLVRLDAQGNCEWTRELPGYYTETWSGPTPVQQTQDGGYITAAEVLLKTASLGNVQWNRSYDDVRVIFSVQQTTDGGFIATGFGRNPEIPSPAQNIILLKTNSQGQKIWKRIFRGSGPSFGSNVRQTPDGGFFITGQSGRPYLIRTDSQGNAIWTKALLDVGTNVARWGKWTADGGYIIVANHHLVKLAPESQ